MRLSPNFLLSEFTNSATAIIHGVDNTPTPEHLENLYMLASKLEDIRRLLGHKPIKISSSYRNPELNRLVGGVSNSDHALGLAADFTCPGFGTPYEICIHISDKIEPFDQLIFEQGNTDWVHLGLGERMRGELLSWKKGQGYVHGIKKLR